MKKSKFLGIITVICCLNLCAKSNEVIKINNSSRQVVADKIEDNLENVLNFNQANIISSEMLKELNKSSSDKNADDNSESTLIHSK